MTDSEVAVPDESDDVEPVELLVQLAEDDEIEPWDIDIVSVTDAFLAKLDSADLRTSGRALFYASALHRMKGDELLAEDDEDEECDDWEVEMGMGSGMDGGFEEPFPEDPITDLEREMERRLDRKHARGSPETLVELVRELRDAERDSWWKESREYDTSGSPKGFQRGTQTLDYHAADDFRAADEPTAEDVTGTAHGEDIEDTITRVYDALDEQYSAGREEVLFTEISSVGGSRVETFLALLFLAHRGQIRLQQDDLFRDLWIRNPAATGESAEAIAD